jgi:hypothetical protein
MKPAAFHYIAIAGGLAIFIAVGLGFAASRPASASARSAFVRPNFEPARPSEAVDLTRHWMLGEREKLDGLSLHKQACYDALDGAGVRYTPIAAARNSKGCGYNDDAVTIDKSFVKYSAPETLVMTCGLAARLELWEREVVAPAAEKHFGVPLTGVVAFGTFSCRRVNGDGPMSEHAYARAADISGFRLADGRTITVLKSFRAKGAEGAFLREIHDRACDVFDVTLGPDYNAEHANHFHLDVGGGHACR